MTSPKNSGPLLSSPGSRIKARAASLLQSLLGQKKPPVSAETPVVPQPVPEVSREDVARILLRDFPVEEAGALQTILDEYGTEKSQSHRDRVQLAVLKLADGHAGALRLHLEIAKWDFRDVLSAAEFPGYRFLTAMSSQEEKNEVVETDWQQYERWLTRA